MATVKNNPSTASVPATEQEAPSSRPSPVTTRAFLLGLILALGMCAIMPYNDYFVGATYLSGNYFPIVGVAAILLLTMLVNPILIAIKRRDAIFTSAEIVTVWSLIVVVAGIPSSGLMRYLIPHIVAPTYYQNATNGWQASIVSHLPQRLIVTDPAAVKCFFEGLPRGESVPWSAWAQPLAWWSLFTVLMYTVFFSLTTIVRRQWVENEHLTFPLVRLPILLAETPEPGRSLPAILRSPLLWSAVILVTVIHTLKGLHLFYPSIPDIPLSVHSSDMIKSPPMNAVNDISFAVFPLIIGFSYFLSTETSFSLWFFYLVFKAQTVIASINAWDMSGTGSGINMGPGFMAYQEAGGTLMIAFWLAWSMRTHLKEAWRKAAGHGGIDDSNEAMSYRSAFIGLAAGYIGLFTWLTLAADVQPLMAFGVLAGSLAIFILLSWLVAQAGLLFIQVSFAPSQIATVLSSPGTFNAQSLCMGSMAEHIGWYDSRESMLPSLLNIQKTATSSALSQRSLAKSMAVLIALALVVSAAASIWLPYTHGGATSLSDLWGYVQAPQVPFKWTQSIMHARAVPITGILGNLASGAAVVFALMTARSLVASFPLHPAGFLVASTFPMCMMWFSLFLGWLLKAPIMRYAGIKGYQQFLPFFLGLILGDSINAIIWTVVGLISHTGYRLLPG